jgi:hypothetical protein
MEARGLLQTSQFRRIPDYCHRPSESPFRLWFAGRLPGYGVIRDRVGTWLAPHVFLVWDSRSWWAFDFVSWALSLWTMLYVFRRAGRSVASPT